MLCYLTVDMLYQKKSRASYCYSTRLSKKKRTSIQSLQWPSFAVCPLSLNFRLPSPTTPSSSHSCCISIAHPSYLPTRATPPKFCQALATSAWYEIFFLLAGLCDFFYWLAFVIFSTGCSSWSHTHVTVIKSRNSRPPTSKTCCRCEHVCEAQGRSLKCPGCRYERDRDHNAATNTARAVLMLIREECWPDVLCRDYDLDTRMFISKQ